MKKISLLVVSVFLSTLLFAQRGADFGIKAGLNVANMSIEPDVRNTDVRLGLHAGLLAHIHLAPEWALQPELVYSGQGFEDKVSNVTWKLDYINVPIMIQYMFNNGFRLEAGPQVGFLASAKIDNTDIKDDLKKIDAGLGFGIGYLSYSGFGIDARYNLGLSNVNDGGSTELKNRVFQVGLFYMFNSQHKAVSR
jgi:hypothetical protein